MNRRPLPPEPVPFTFQPCPPVTENMHLVEEYDHTAMGACRRLRPRPDTFPEARHGGLWAVTRRIETRGSGLPFQLEDECGLAYLARPSQQLDPSGRRFGEPLPEKAAAVLIVHG